MDQVNQEKKYEYEEAYSHDTNLTMEPLKGIAVPDQFERKDFLEDDRAFILNDFLSEEECRYYIDESEKLGYEELTYQKRYRNNDRCVVNSEQISEFLWQRLKPLIKPIIVTPKDYKQIGNGLKLEGVWNPVGLNPCWRLCKYHPGGHFSPHHDGPFIKSSEERSLKTLNIYLNGDFEGGTTNFINESQGSYVDSNGRIVAEEQNIKFRVVPSDGLALIFNHHILHEGEALKTNIKYIMRSDIMFRREEPPKVDGKEAEAISLYNQANKLEVEGKFREAAALYAKAARIWPEIEFSQKV